MKLVYFPLRKKDANKKFIDRGIEVVSLDRRLGALIILVNYLKMIQLNPDSNRLLVS